MYESTRLKGIAQLVAAGEPSITPADRSGLVYDAMALAKAGSAVLSDGLTFIDTIAVKERERKCCIVIFLRVSPDISYIDVVWSAIEINLAAIRDVWWEHPEIVEQLNQFYRVRR